MAKLSAHGRVVSKWQRVKPETVTTVTVHADGAVLHKVKYSTFSDGWKRWGLMETRLKRDGYDRAVEGIQSLGFNRI